MRRKARQGGLLMRLCWAPSWETTQWHIGSWAVPCLNQVHKHAHAQIRTHAHATQPPTHKHKHVIRRCTRTHARARAHAAHTCAPFASHAPARGLVARALVVAARAVLPRVPALPLAPAPALAGTPPEVHQQAAELDHAMAPRVAVAKAGRGTALPLLLRRARPGCAAAAGPR